MADPVIVACPEGEWTKVATNAITGNIHRKSLKPGRYLQTYRDTAGVAPTLVSEGVPIFTGVDSESIAAVSGIDVYIWPVGAAGSVRIDL